MMPNRNPDDGTRPDRTGVRVKVTHPTCSLLAMGLVWRLPLPDGNVGGSG